MRTRRDRPGERHDLSALRSIVSTGSPLPTSTWHWTYDAVKRDLLLGSDCGGTDVCTAFIGTNPMLPVYAGELQAPYLGVKVEAWSPQGSLVLGEVGEMVVTEPMPSMPLTFWNDPDGTRYLELIQYAPQTPTVRTRPLLVVPPVINKFYVSDLAPGRSLVEYLVQNGQQVFMISWRNPDARHRGWDLDTYGQAILDSLDAARRITDADSAVTLGFCSGGTLLAMTMAALAARGALTDRVAGFGLSVCVLDQAKAGAAGALLDDTTAKAATAVSAARGYLEGGNLAEVFAWLRPDDLIWNYWVNNYLQGRDPAPFDILFWNADTTRMTAGHIASIVNPPGNPKASYQTSDDLPTDAAAFRESTPSTAGSWWPDYLAWPADHSGPESPAPTDLGGRGLPPLDPAPGTYVMDR